MSLEHSYTLIAPFYDALLDAASRRSRQRSLAPLLDMPAGEVLVNGIGTGLDLPHLPPSHRYTGLDLTRVMLKRALPRAAALDFQAVQGNAQQLPFADGRFDAVVLHLILAVVPDPPACLRESVRVTRPGGTLLIFDKFLKPGERSLWKRALNPLSRRLATRLDVVFEELLASVPGLRLVRDEPAMASGWFRLIRLQKTNQLR